MNAQPIKVSLVHLGCARNQVDSEVMLGHLAEQGVMLCGDIADADVALVNTCSFIGPAREESFQAIESVVKRKKRGHLKAVLVAGCLAEKFKDDIQKRTPDVDAVLPISDYSQIAQVVNAAVSGENARACPAGREKGKDSDKVRLLTTPGSYAYLRISEGCDHTCSFCIIPSIRGPMKSKPIEVLVEEATNLASMGVKELVLVAEDSTWYGRDLGDHSLLPQLVEALTHVDGIEWIRIHYAYPNSFPWDLTRVMREQSKVLPYLDIPIQHIADPVLRAMRRAGSGSQVRDILQRLRDEVPGIVLRTTLIVGFPGESEADFETLLQFLEDFPIDRMSAFPYSDEPKAPAIHLPDKVDPAVAQHRFEKLMTLQTERLVAQNREKIGQNLEVILDGVDSQGGWIGRTQADAPEVDCGILLPPEQSLSVGSIVQARVTGVSEDGFDLIGK